MPLPTNHHYHPHASTNRSSQQHQNANTNNPPPPSSPHLTSLRHDEILIRNRKANIRRFGAGWLRPPGVPKTLQGMVDERAEREEQELTAQREQAMMEAQAAAEEEAALEAVGPEGGMMPVGPDGRLIRVGAGQQGQEEGEGDEGEDDMRDLDDMVPDASAVMEVHEGWESSDEDEEEEEEGSQENEGLSRGVDEGGEVSLALDADLLGHQHSFTGAGEEGEGDYNLPGMLEGEGRDLDEDVPEAGSYQHTDTEVEDESSTEEGRSFITGVGGTAGGVLGRSVWGGSPIGVMAGGAYDGPAGGERRSSRRTGRRSSRGRRSRD
ncbi:MAG: hypothetical protein Q9166_004285 [cf. Caloplaca sp. 2 TL-2023]